MTLLSKKSTGLVDVKRDFIQQGGLQTQKLYLGWQARHDLQQAGVVQFVDGFTHQRIYEITTAQFNAVTSAMDEPLGQPLGNIFPNPPSEDPDDKLSVAFVENVGRFSPWSFQQIFHCYVEKNGLPTWQNFESFLKGPARVCLYDAYRMELWSDYWDAIGASARLIGNLNHTNTVESQFDLGLQWRLGNFYLSALREVEVVVRLRAEHGVDVNYHILADAEFKADAWIRDATGKVRVLCLLIPSPYYNRKASAGSRLPSAFFETQLFKIERLKVKGKYWPIAPDSLTAMCSFLANRPCRCLHVSNQI